MTNSGAYVDPPTQRLRVKYASITNTREINCCIMSSRKPSIPISAAQLIFITMNHKYPRGSFFASMYVPMRNPAAMSSSSI